MKQIALDTILVETILDNWAIAYIFYAVQDSVSRRRLLRTDIRDLFFNTDLARLFKAGYEAGIKAV